MQIERDPFSHIKHDDGDGEKEGYRCRDDDDDDVDEKSIQTLFKQIWDDDDDDAIDGEDYVICVCFYATVYTIVATTRVMTSARRLVMDCISTKSKEREKKKGMMTFFLSLSLSVASSSRQQKRTSSFSNCVSYYHDRFLMSSFLIDTFIFHVCCCFFFGRRK